MSPKTITQKGKRTLVERMRREAEAILMAYPDSAIGKDRLKKAEALGKGLPAKEPNPGPDPKKP